MADIQNSKVSDLQRGFALLAVGEVGRVLALTTDGLDNIITGCFTSQSEDVKASASSCLGCICVGNPVKFFPTVVQNVKTSDKKYLLLQALKEVITQATSSPDMVKPYIDQLLPLFLDLAALEATEDEGVRNIAGECLGKLALVQPAQIVPVLLENVTNANPKIRATIVIAIKFTVTGTSAECDALLGPKISLFLAALGDADLAVRRAALLTVNTMIRNKTHFVRDCFGGEDNLLSVIYNETKVKPELQRKVQMGPFTIRVDDGLELRVAAFECLDTILDQCIDKVDPNEFVTHLTAGIADDIDVKMICQLLALKAADLFPAAVAAGLDAMCEAFASTFKIKLKADAVPTEIQRHEDCVKSCCKAVVRMTQLDASSESARLKELVTQLEGDEKVKDKYAAAVEEMAGEKKGDFMDI